MGEGNRLGATGPPGEELGHRGGVKGSLSLLVGGVCDQGMSPRSPEHATCPHWQKMSWLALTGSLRPAEWGAPGRQEGAVGNRTPTPTGPCAQPPPLPPAASPEQTGELGGFNCPSLRTVTGPLHTHHPSRLHWAGRTTSSSGISGKQEQCHNHHDTCNNPWCDPILRGTRAQRGKKNLPKASQLGEWTGCHLISLPEPCILPEARPAQPAVPVCRDKGPLVGLVELP